MNKWEEPLSLIHLSLDCGRKVDQVRRLTDTWRTWKLHSISLWCASENYWTTAYLNCWVVFLILWTITNSVATLFFLCAVKRDFPPCSQSEAEMTLSSVFVWVGLAAGQDERMDAHTAHLSAAAVDQPASVSVWEQPAVSSHGRTNRLRPIPTKGGADFGLICLPVGLSWCSKNSAQGHISVSASWQRVIGQRLTRK